MSVLPTSCCPAFVHFLGLNSWNAARAWPGHAGDSHFPVLLFMPHFEPGLVLGISSLAPQNTQAHTRLSGCDAPNCYSWNAGGLVFHGGFQQVLENHCLRDVLVTLESFLPSQAVTGVSPEGSGCSACPSAGAVFSLHRGTGPTSL